MVTTVTCEDCGKRHPEHVECSCALTSSIQRPEFPIAEARAAVRRVVKRERARKRGRHWFDMKLQGRAS